MLFLLKIFLAHILGDFLLQPKSWVHDKEKNKIASKKLYLHVLAHFLLLLIFLEFKFKEYWLGFLLIIISHFTFDVLKIYFQKKKTKIIWFFLDQFLHVFMLIYTAIIYNKTTFNIDTYLTEKILLLIITILLITNVTSVIIKVFITQWNPESKKENDDSLAKAGWYIGVLERLFVFVFIITNHWEAIGFLLAAKSVFRFGDLTSSKDRKLTEYILIGTLLSFGFAILIGMLYLYCIKFI